MALIVGGITVTGTQTLDATKLTGNLPAISGASLTSLNGSNITSGTVAAARVDNLSAAKITSGTMDGARISGGTLGATNGSNLTNLPAASSIPVVAAGSVGSFSLLGIQRTYNYASGAANQQTYNSTFSGGRIMSSNQSGTSSGSIGGTWRNTSGTFDINENSTPKGAGVCQRIS